MRERLASLRRVFAQRVLGVEDTPHRIAWGVFLGMVVAFTPTLGFQIVFYLGVATMLRANKVSGVPFLFITNPVTAVPVYWLTWKVGHLLLGGSRPHVGGPTRDQLLALAGTTEAGGPTFADQALTLEFWAELGRALVRLGGELWLGGVVLGMALGVPAYFATLWIVRAFRARGKGAESVRQAG